MLQIYNNGYAIQVQWAEGALQHYVTVPAKGEIFYVACCCCFAVHPSRNILSKLLQYYFSHSVCCIPTQRQPLTQVCHVISSFNIL
jgi:hypothetical protein